MQMQPTDWSPERQGQRVLAVGVAVLFVATAFASVAVAQSAIGFRTAEVSATEATVGENITVSAEAVNVGDSQGGYTFEFQHNGTDLGTGWVTFENRRVTIPANDDRRISANVSFDQPGTYRIRVNENGAGVVRVRPASARVASVNDTQRRIDIIANGVSATEPTQFDIPASNRSVTLQRWTTTTGQSAFQQHLTEYTDPAEAPGSLPAPTDATLLGVIEFGSDDEVQGSTMRVAVDDAALANSTLERDAVTVYQRNGTAWEPLATSVVSDGANRTVYEAAATRGTTYAVGRMTPNITVGNASSVSTGSDGGVRLILDARLQNTGPVAGPYRGVLRVNGEAVNATTVTVPAKGERSVSLSHEVTEAGQYRLSMNGTRAGSVFIPEGQLAGSTDGATNGTATPTGATGGDGGSVEDALPETVLGIDTPYVLGGLAIALGAFAAILLLLRRGGEGGGGRPDDFDPW